jgi:hypothetical protein
MRTDLNRFVRFLTMGILTTIVTVGEMMVVRSDAWKSRTREEEATPETSDTSARHPVSSNGHFHRKHTSFASVHDKQCDGET